jgi:hypothetical protein
LPLYDKFYDKIPWKDVEGKKMSQDDIPMLTGGEWGGAWENRGVKQCRMEDINQESVE